LAAAEAVVVGAHVDIAAECEAQPVAINEGTALAAAAVATAVATAAVQAAIAAAAAAAAFERERAIGAAAVRTVATVTARDLAVTTDARAVGVALAARGPSSW
jgi:hypothetical protein